MTFVDSFFHVFVVLIFECGFFCMKLIVTHWASQLRFAPSVGLNGFSGMLSVFRLEMPGGDFLLLKETGNNNLPWTFGATCLLKP